MTLAIPRAEPASARITHQQVLAFLVAMVFVTSFYVKFEPAPTDMFVAMAFVFAIGGGLRFTPAIMPLLLFLLIYNVAGLVSYTLIPDDQLDSKAYLIGLALTSVSGIFFAAYVSADPANRYRQIIKAYWVGATIGATLGLISYFKIQPFYGLFPDFAGRALGGYKDPNVYSTWLVFPAVTMLQALMLGTLRLRPVAIISFMLIFAALFLAFSRGAWINALTGTMLTVFFSFVLAPGTSVRGRIIAAGLLGTLVLGLALAALLSYPPTRDLFLDRFTLVKSYDAGETGRFGNQLNSIPILQTLPFGLGPYQFAAIFDLAPHNTFLNSFSSAGWIGGITYMLLILSDLIVGFRAMLARTAFQPYAIVSFSCLLSVVIQGVQIDTEHWRHLYWMTGLCWGFFAASRYQSALKPSFEELATCWNLKPSPKAKTR